MAVRHGYGKIAGTDALVFAYDTGDTRNSYRGEPTANLITHVLPNSNWSTNGSGVIITQNYGYDHNGVLRSSKIVDNPNSGNGAFAYTSALNVSAGTYTFSAKVKTSSAAASTNCYMVLYDMDPITNLGSTTFTNLTPGEWTNVAVTATLASGTTRIAPHFMTPTGNVNDFIEVVDVQLEQKSHATPFAGPLGTRSSTQGLLDLTGNRTIDLTNAGFDSNAQISLDGSNDSFETTSNLANLTDLASGTVELVFKWSAGTDYTVLLHAFSGTSYYGTTVGLGNWTGGYDDESIYLFVHEADGTQRVNSLYRNGHYTYRDGLYHHLVFTVGDNTVRGYLDGTEISLTSSSGTKLTQSSVTKLQVGKREYGGGTGFHSGEVPVAKIYNRALTAAEVRNNYNQYKGRFNI